jgi:hypothetical protein
LLLTLLVIALIAISIADLYVSDDFATSRTGNVTITKALVKANQLSA